ncbi:unnamed protein product [Brassica rapa]|uniref:Uncharacterized protein n=1 Tax=Brassica campestris TaxID=3711 RepID=A0A3P5XXM3_BRACM|nr:unnamed protein product [Brassica rapa]VDC59516.1 unnamed protein product [Brassica rapa]
MATSPNEPDDTLSASSFFNPHLMKKWEALSSVRHKPNPNKVVWTNEMLKDRKVINLDAWNQVGTFDERIQIIREALTSLTTEVSVRSVGALMVCAWGLVSCENPNESVFGGLWESSKARELEEYTRLSDGILCKSSRWRSPPDDKDLILFTTTGNGLNWVRTACFYCAAVLRLATKEHDALVKAWSYLPEHYQSFYKTPLEFSLSLDHECLKCLRRLLQKSTTIRNSVAPFLLAFQELSGSSKNRAICKTLFESHLGFTGLHAYTLFISNATKLAVPHHVFRHVLRHHAAEEGLETIMEILKRYEDPSLDEGDRKSKCTWIYSRIFDSDMFGSLQTKRCVFLAALLAVIADTIGGTSSSGGGSGQASNIKQLQGYIQNNQDDLHLWAGRIIAFCKEFNEKESTKK